TAGAGPPARSGGRGRWSPRSGRRRPARSRRLLSWGAWSSGRVHRGSFALQQLAFQRQAPAIAARAAVPAHHAMTGDQHRDLVAGAGTGHGAGRGRLPEFGRQLRVAAGFAGWDLHQRVPDLLLERGAEQVEPDFVWRPLAALARQARGDRLQARGEELVATGVDTLQACARELGA